MIILKSVSDNSNIYYAVGLFCCLIFSWFLVIWVLFSSGINYQLFCLIDGRQKFIRTNHLIQLRLIHFLFAFMLGGSLSGSPLKVWGMIQSLFLTSS